MFKYVKSNISLLQAIELYGFMPVKKGSHYFILCPFHADKNPSLAIYEDVYHCFGCQAHGDVIDFVSRYFNLTQPEALEKLAQDFGINLPNEKQKKKFKRQALKMRNDDKLYKEYIRKYNEVYDYLCKLNQLYTKIKQVVENPEDINTPEFIEACHMQDLIQYWIDLLLEGSTEDKIHVIKEVLDWKAKMK
ncbi:CHC2 zinc finger domain-containing protein [Thermoanaerobacterium sp. RBIITD]|uniref:CHC2 zinc finger domain-containing protein n=1 Tax=Thermoanaerobacterium sp. RBIITD TaxID=1550240 RepID=UPI000BC0460C|nr:CHC2 zinc finger domain-containing protein [Thermoanaerobacterium sp. RBIITD]SNX52987.1 CHC2 zinc finger [Thermoanaerobacterium sp. RBIITD]